MASGTSYNGWPANSDPDAIGVDNFGDAHGYPFPGGVKSGDVTTVLGYVCLQLHERVEPCIGGYCWGWTFKQNVNNPSQLSCHASGTAVDWNAPLHGNGSSASESFTDQQIGEIYAILNEVQGAVDWLSDYDPMHFEIAVNASELAIVAASLPGSNPPPTDWLEMVTEDQWNDLVGKVTECQTRLRGEDTGPGERHESFDMLQGIDSNTVDTQYRVRGPEADFDMLQDILGKVNTLIARPG